MPISALVFMKNGSLYFLFLGRFAFEIPESPCKMAGYLAEGTMWRGHMEKKRDPDDPASSFSL